MVKKNGLPGGLLAESSGRADISWSLRVGEDSSGHACPVLVDSIGAGLRCGINFTDKGLEDDNFLGNLIRGDQVCSQLGNSSLAGFTVNLIKKKIYWYNKLFCLIKIMVFLIFTSKCVF